MRIDDRTPYVPRAHAGRGDVCDPQSGGRARLSGQPERTCVLATTTVWPMKCERVKRCLVSGVQEERLVCLNSWGVSSLVECLEAAETGEGRKSRVLGSHCVEFLKSN